MKNAINYYYNLYPNNIYQNDRLYKFSIESVEYYLVPYNNDLRTLTTIYELSKTLKQYNIYCHEIVENTKKELSININNKQYVLLKTAQYNDQKLNFDNLMYYPLVTSSLHLENIIHPKNWRNLWMEKIDYFEYQVSNFKKKFPLIRETSSYYIGLAENGIQMLLEAPNSHDYCISHHRIKNYYTLFDLYNPLEFTIDSKIRDITEYCKEEFFYNTISIDSIIYYIDNYIFNKEQAILFFSRLLYPSYYFDLCDDIIYNNLNENFLSNIINKNYEYEQFLSRIITYLHIKYQVPEIEWLKKS